jgi:DNA-binding CsgD family transcriptional regulator
MQSRQAELDRVAGLLQDARRGRGRSIVVRGEVGVGKSWLCEQAVAAADGMWTVALRGVPAEAHLAYAVLFDALSPLLGLLDRIPPAQAAALRSALRFDADAAADRLAVAVGCLALLRTAATRQPLLVVVDDAQWVDEGTLETLRFSARRLDTNCVAFVFVLRTGEGDPLAGAGFEELALAELGEREALTLLKELVPRLDADVARRLAGATGGNPLALCEAVRELSAEQRAGRAPLPTPLPTPEAIQEAFGRRLAALPDPTRRALVVAAANEMTLSRVLERALAEMGLGLSALEPAETQGLVSLDDGLRFAHPLLRSAAYHGAPPSLRRAAQRALAAKWADADFERQAWHRPEAARGANGEAGVALAAAARAARKRATPGEAAQAFRAAAPSSNDRSERARLLFEGARELARTTRGPRVLALLDEAAGCHPEPSLRAEIELLRGQTLMWHGDPEGAESVLLTEAARIQDSDPSRAIRLLSEAAFSRTMAGDNRGCVELAQRAHSASAGLGPAVAAGAALTLGFALVLVGEGRRGYPLCLHALNEMGASIGRVQPPETTPVPLWLLLVWMEDYELARRGLREAIYAARERGALAELPSTLSYQAELDFRTGDWLAARASATEAVQLARQTDHESSYALVTQARLDAALGREAEARENAEAVLTASLSSRRVWATAALGLLELGGGCPQRAVAHLERAATLAAASGIGEPNVVQWAPDLIEAQTRAGRPEQARQTLAAFEQQAGRSGRLWAKTAAARCRGLLASDGETDRAFGEATRCLAQLPSPFEIARTELCWGERLRRQGRRVEARGKLHQALERFDAVGAEPWSEQAHRELRASGERTRRGPRARSEQLTPQEFQVALLVAEGLTNKEVAQRLFLSPKTIEFHLGHIYRKLNIHSRARLAHVLTRASASREHKQLARFD